MGFHRTHGRFPRRKGINPGSSHRERRGCGSPVAQWGADTSTGKAYKDERARRGVTRPPRDNAHWTESAPPRGRSWTMEAYLMGDPVGPGDWGWRNPEGRRVWGPRLRPGLTVRQGLTAFEADLEPEGAVERARVLQHSHIQHRHLGHHRAREPQLLWGLLHNDLRQRRRWGTTRRGTSSRLPTLPSEALLRSARTLQIAGSALQPIAAKDR